jgi:phosphoglycolate phosphatase-like HAD superfamily hydrolase
MSRNDELLALFDVDKTVFMTSDPLLGLAVVQTLRERFDVELPDDAIGHVDHPGQTTKRIARLILEWAGVDGADLDGWCPLASARYLELLEDIDTSHWRARTGSREGLAELRAAGVRLALLTGLPEPVAHVRMERVGLAEFFPPGGGAFGCDTEDRVELIEIARRRAGGWPRERTVAVGDTTKDRESAAAAGIGYVHGGPDDDLRDVAKALLPR